MTPEKQKQKLAGQTAIAQKVFQAVPIAEAWTVAQISQALHRTTGARRVRPESKEADKFGVFHFALTNKETA